MGDKTESRIEERLEEIICAIEDCGDTQEANDAKKLAQNLLQDMKFLKVSELVLFNDD